MNALATPKQISFIQHLATERGRRCPPPDELERWPRQRASQAIAQLLELPKVRSSENDQPASGPFIPGQIEDGYYTAVFNDGGHRTFRVRSYSDGRMAGKRVIAFLSGSDNANGYTGCGFVTDEGVRFWRRHANSEALHEGVRIIMADPEAAGRGYALRSGNCYRCNKLLTEPESIRLGIGPVCRSKRGA